MHEGIKQYNEIKNRKGSTGFSNKILSVFCKDSFSRVTPVQHVAMNLGMKMR